MLKIHQLYIKTSKYRSRYTFTLASIGVLLLGSLVVVNSFSVDAKVYASGDSRTLSDISTMQEMTQQICSNSDEGEVATLLDDRGSKISYKVIKMLDGTCWMAENLRLVNTTITSSDSDMTSGSFTIPASSLTNFGSSMSTTDGYAAHAYYNNDTVYGAYYNWYTATAGAGTSNVTSGDVSTSICPKGWKLPAYNGTGSFYNIISGTNGYKSSWNNANKGYYFGNTNAFWPVAGYVYISSIDNAGSDGYYWSRRAGGSDRVYSLVFGSSDVYPQSNYFRYLGYSVRCVAVGGLDKIKKPLFTEEKDGNVNVAVPSTLTIDTTSGMAENADSSKITEGTATATVSSNTNYTVTLHSTQPSLKDPSVTTAEISPVSNDNPVTPSNNSWGFWNGITNGNAKVYDTPITTTPQEFYNTTISSITDKGNTTTHTYYVGISIAPSLPSGTYSTDVTITAAAK